MNEIDQKSSTEALTERTKDFKLTNAEKELVSILEEIHRIEASRQATVESDDEADLATKISSLRTAASSMVDLKRERYLLFGDYLATRFNDALDRYLSLARTKKLQNNPEKNAEGMHLVQTGGSFLSNSLRCGAITHDGVLNTPKITPQVLFRVRWRHFAKLRLDLEFTDAEKLAYYSFAAEFAEKSSKSSRLSAISEVKKECPSFDTELARAIVMHEAGDNERAIKELKNAITAGRGNTEMKSFLRALE